MIDFHTKGSVEQNVSSTLAETQHVILLVAQCLFIAPCISVFITTEKDGQEVLGFY